MTLVQLDDAMSIDGNEPCFEGRVTSHTTHRSNVGSVQASRFIIGPTNDV